MKRSEKFGFKTGEEMVEVFKNNKMAVVVSISNGFKCRKYCPEGVCGRCTLDYLNEEIETNFEHYKKEFAQFISELKLEDFIFGGQFSFTEYMFKELGIWGEYKHRRVLETLLQQEYKP